MDGPEDEAPRVEWDASDEDPGLSLISIMTEKEDIWGVWSPSCRCFRRPFALPSTEVALTHWDSQESPGDS